MRIIAKVYQHEWRALQAIALEIILKATNDGGTCRRKRHEAGHGCANYQTHRAFARQIEQFEQPPGNCFFGKGRGW